MGKLGSAFASKAVFVRKSHDNSTCNKVCLVAVESMRMSVCMHVFVHTQLRR